MEAIPKEVVLYEIFSFLEVFDLLGLSSVSSFFHDCSLTYLKQLRVRVDDIFWDTKRENCFLMSLVQYSGRNDWMRVKLQPTPKFFQKTLSWGVFQEDYQKTLKYLVAYSCGKFHAGKRKFASVLSHFLDSPYLTSTILFKYYLPYFMDENSQYPATLFKKMLNRKIIQIWSITKLFFTRGSDSLMRPGLSKRNDNHWKFYGNLLIDEFGWKRLFRRILEHATKPNSVHARKLAISFLQDREYAGIFTRNELLYLLFAFGDKNMHEIYNSHETYDLTLENFKSSFRGLIGIGQTDPIVETCVDLPFVFHHRYFCGRIKTRYNSSLKEGRFRSKILRKEFEMRMIELLNRKNVEGFVMNFHHQYLGQHILIRALLQFSLKRGCCVQIFRWIMERIEIDSFYSLYDHEDETKEKEVRNTRNRCKETIIEVLKNSYVVDKIPLKGLDKTDQNDFLSQFRGILRILIAKYSSSWIDTNEILFTLTNTRLQNSIVFGKDPVETIHVIAEVLVLSNPDFLPSYDAMGKENLLTLCLKNFHVCYPIIFAILMKKDKLEEWEALQTKMQVEISKIVKKRKPMFSRTMSLVGGSESTFSLLTRFCLYCPSESDVMERNLETFFEFFFKCFTSEYGKKRKESLLDFEKVCNHSIGVVLKKFCGTPEDKIKRDWWTTSPSWIINDEEEEKEKVLVKDERKIVGLISFLRTKGYLCEKNESVESDKKIKKFRQNWFEFMYDVLFQFNARKSSICSFMDVIAKSTRLLFFAQESSKNCISKITCVREEFFEMLVQDKIISTEGGRRIAMKILEQYIEAIDEHNQTLTFSKTKFLKIEMLRNKCAIPKFVCGMLGNLEPLHEPGFGEQRIYDKVLDRVFQVTEEMTEIKWKKEVLGMDGKIYKTKKDSLIQKFARHGGESLTKIISFFLKIGVFASEDCSDRYLTWTMFLKSGFGRILMSVVEFPKTGIGALFECLQKNVKVVIFDDQKKKKKKKEYSWIIEMKKEIVQRLFSEICGKQRRSEMLKIFSTISEKDQMPNVLEYYFHILKENLTAKEMRKHFHEIFQFHHNYYDFGLAPSGKTGTCGMEFFLNLIKIRKMKFSGVSFAEDILDKELVFDLLKFYLVKKLFQKNPTSSTTFVFFDSKRDRENYESMIVCLLELWFEKMTGGKKERLLGCEKLLELCQTEKIGIVPCLIDHPMFVLFYKERCQDEKMRRKTKLLFQTLFETHLQNKKRVTNELFVWKKKVGIDADNMRIIEKYFNDERFVEEEEVVIGTTNIIERRKEIFFSLPLELRVMLCRKNRICEGFAYSSKKHRTGKSFFTMKEMILKRQSFVCSTCLPLSKEQELLVKKVKFLKLCPVPSMVSVHLDNAFIYQGEVKVKERKCIYKMEKLRELLEGRYVCWSCVKHCHMNERQKHTIHMVDVGLSSKLLEKEFQFKCVCWKPQRWCCDFRGKSFCFDLQPESKK